MVMKSHYLKFNGDPGILWLMKKAWFFALIWKYSWVIKISAVVSVPFHGILKNHENQPYSLIFMEINFMGWGNIHPEKNMKKT